jgi:hypothetical protein
MLLKEIDSKIKEDFLFDVEKKFIFVARGETNIDNFTSFDAYKVWKLIEQSIP